MKKIKEKIFFIKELWSNKKTRALVFFGFYFIFFLVISILFRISPSVDNSVTQENSDFNVSLILDNFEKYVKNDYKYSFMINNDNITIDVKDGVKNIYYQGNKYILISNKFYLETEYSLELINQNEIFPDILLNVVNIEDLIKELENLTVRYDSVISENFVLIYEHSFELTTDDLVTIKLLGNANMVNTITIVYGDKLYNLVFEE